MISGPPPVARDLGVASRLRTLSSSSCENGLRRKSVAPALMASTAVGTVPNADRTTTGNSDFVRRMCSSSSSPSMPGMRRSVNTAATSKCSSFCAASMPLEAISTAKPFRRNAASTAACICKSSSTTSNRFTHNLHVALQSNIERRPLWGGRDIDSAIVALDNTFHYGKAQPATFAMGRKRRIENAAERDFGNAAPVVSNRQEDFASCQVSLQTNRSFFGSLSQRIQNEIQKHPMHQLSICHDRGAGFANSLDLNMISRRHWLQKPTDFFEQL